MPSPYGFERVPVRLFDRNLYGRVIRGYEHPTGLWLVHHKPRSHNATGYHQNGIWLLYDGVQVVARRSYFGRSQRLGPLQWADRKAREYANGAVVQRNHESPPQAALPQGVATT